MRVSAAQLIELRGASFGYDHTPVLTDVDLTVRQGDVLAVLGSNGSGKSTLIRGMLGIAEQLAGEVLLFGQPRSQFRDRWRIGFVPQRNHLAGSLPVTVREVVESGRIMRNPIWKRFGAADRDAVANALATVGLAELATDALQSLSGGQQRRVAIARALAAEPELLILDEPTAGVDAETQARLADTLEELSAAGTTVVLIEHELGMVAHLIDRVVVMKHGRVGYDGPPDAAHHHHADHEHHQHDSEPLRPGTGLEGW